MRSTAQQGRGTASWEALGSSVVVRVLDPKGLAAARRAVERELDAIDSSCSRFKSHSELSTLNRRAGRRTPLSGVLSLDAAAITDGAVDPTVGRCLELIGYDRDFDLIREADAFHDADPPVPAQPRARARLTARTVVGWRRVRLDRESGSVQIPRGVTLDLGATAKAWAADRAASAAAAAGHCGALVGIGGDFATAGAAPVGGWAMKVTDDHRAPAGAGGQLIQVSSGGLATSSTTVRRWQAGGKAVHHVIDPRTGAPASSPWRTVSVAAATCAEANIAATATLAKGEDGERWLRATGLPARLVSTEGDVTVMSDWPAQERT